MKKHFSFLVTLCTLFITTGAGCINFGSTAQGPMGVFRSNDKGESWTSIAAYPTAQGVKSLEGLKVYRIFSDPSDTNTMYLASRGQGLFYTYDNGATWQAVSALGNAFIYGLAVDPKDKCTIYATDGQKIFKTTDCSRTWQYVYTEQRPEERFAALAVDFSDSNIVYALQFNGDFLMSVKGGEGWRTVRRFGQQMRDLQVDPRQPHRVYIATYRDGLWRSEDGGLVWAHLQDGFSPYSGSQEFYRLILNPGQPDSLFWISKYGILRSDNAGGSWTDLKLLTPPGGVVIFGFAINPKNQKEMYYTGTLLGEGNVHVRSTFYKTSDGGNNWITKKLPTNTIPTIIRLHPDNENILFMGFTTLEE